MDESNLEKERNTIKKMLGIDPLKWRYLENGDLVYLNSAGQKFTLTAADVQKLIADKLAEKASYQPKPGPKQKVKELTEEQAPYNAEKK